MKNETLCRDRNAGGLETHPDALRTDVPIRQEVTPDLMILLGLSLVIGIYLIATTQLISKDGIFYIEWARQLPSGPGKLAEKHSVGYPALVFGMHELLSRFPPDSHQAWILSGQAVSLLFRVLTVIPIYLIGRILTNRRTAFLSCLILLILPDPAHFGSDVLRDWPYLFFLSSGFLALLRGSHTGRWQPFVWAGLLAGCGFWIRMEAFHLLFYGLAWIAAGLVLPVFRQDRRRLVISLAAMTAGFLLLFIPHIHVSGRVLPVKIQRLLSDPFSIQTTPVQRDVLAAGQAGELGESCLTLVEKVSENLMYVFVPFWLLGLTARLSRSGRSHPVDRFYMTALLLGNTLMLLLLHSVWNFMDRRHAMPMVALTICYVPVGLEAASAWVAARVSAIRPKHPTSSQTVFWVLLSISIAVCLPKLLRPLGSDKPGYLQAIRWITEHTSPDTLVGSPDNRLPFYAERPYVAYKKSRFPRTVDWCLVIEEEGKTMRLPASFSKTAGFPIRPTGRKQINIYEVQ